MNNIPLTIQTRAWGNIDTRVVLGVSGQSNFHSESFSYTSSNEYCIVVIDRKTGTVVKSITSSDNANIPPEMDAYIGNTQYMMVFTTNGLLSSNLPTGKLYSWLLKEGAGAGLKTIEQYFGALNCGNWAAAGYTFVDVLGDNSSGNPIEAITYTQGASLLALELEAISIADQTFYTPIRIR